MFVTRKVFKLLSFRGRLFRFIIKIITKPVHMDVEDNTQKFKRSCLQMYLCQNVLT